MFKNFMVVVSRTKSFATVEMKEAVTEWQAQLTKVGVGGNLFPWTWCTSFSSQALTPMQHVYGSDLILSILK